MTTTRSSAGAAEQALLPEVLANRRWVRRDVPFPHVVAENVFTPAFYGELHAEFERIQREHPEAFQRSMAGYDAAGAEVAAHRDGPLGIFVSREWHDLLAGVAGVRATADVAASLHHHEPGSASGWPHNDLNPGWFGDPAADAGQIVVTGASGVGYHHGNRPPGVEARETVRAVSLLFFLANPPWQPGDGGETGLFASVDAAGRGQRVTVAPVNNSLVLFECTPLSWHCFLANATPRNSVVMWLHRRRDEVVRRWGEHSIVHW
ncbi:MAG: 2OG-Fe(II) oxygenase [Jatrophihabitantaceae bacterium]